MTICGQCRTPIRQFGVRRLNSLIPRRKEVWAQLGYGSGVRKLGVRLLGGFLAHHGLPCAVQLLDRFDSAVVIGLQAGVEKLIGKFEAK